MNEEQLIATLQACYFGDKGAFNKILKEYKQLQTENQHLKSTLEEIREYIKETLELKEEYPDEVECVVNDLLQIIDKEKCDKGVN